MNNSSEHIDKIFKDGLANASSKAPDGVWESLSTSIAAAETVLVTKSIFATLKWWIASTVVASASVVTYLVVQTPVEKPINSQPKDINETNNQTTSINNSLDAVVDDKYNNAETNISEKSAKGSIEVKTAIDGEQTAGQKNGFSSGVASQIQKEISTSPNPVNDNKLVLPDHHDIKTIVPKGRILSQLNAKSAVCRWEKLEIGFLVKGDVKVLWNFGDDVLKTTNSGTVSHYYKNSGRYTIIADVYDLETGIKLNTLLKEVKVGFDVNVNYRVVSDNTYRFETDVNLDNTMWIFPEQESRIMYGSAVEHTFGNDFVAGKVINICSNEIGCTDTFITWVKNSKEPKCEIFDAFTPNGDGTNDKYYVLAQGYELFSLSISDMTGKLVFNTTNPDTGWDGKYNGVACDAGVYWAKVIVKFPGKSSVTKTQQIKLVKN